MKDLGNVSVTCENVKEITASKRRVLKAWWTQLEHVVNVMDEDAGIESDRLLFYNKVPLATWKNQDIFLNACCKMLGAMYNMTCTYMQEKNRFYVGSTPGLAYVDPIKNACTANDLDRLNILLDGGYDVNKYCGNGRNALLLAALKGCRLDVFQRILENITDVNAFDHSLDTALVIAARENHLDLVKALMKHPEINLNMQCEYKSTALHWAVIENNPAIVAQLLSDERIDIWRRNVYGCTPVELAVIRPECKELLQAHLSS